MEKGERYKNIGEEELYDFLSKNKGKRSLLFEIVRMAGGQPEVPGDEIMISIRDTEDRISCMGLLDDNGLKPAVPKNIEEVLNLFNPNGDFNQRWREFLAKNE